MLGLFFILGLLALYTLFKTYWPLLNWPRQPPGPPVYPLLGSGRALLAADASVLEQPYRAMHRLSAIYGSVFRVALGQDLWVVLTGLEAIKSFCMMSETTDRPDLSTLFDIYGSHGDQALGVIFPHGSLWKEQRRFMMRTLRELGMGRSIMEQHIMQELHFCLQHLREKTKLESGLVSMHEFFALPCLNVIWRLACNRRFEYTDDRMKEMIGHIEAFTMEKTLGPIATVPILKHVPPTKAIYNAMKEHLRVFQGFLTDFLRENENKDTDDQQDEKDNEGVRSYAEAFQRAQREKEGEYFDERQLLISIQDFFTGGSGTMSKTLAYAILYLAQHQEVQTRVHHELLQIVKDRSAGKNELVLMEDKSRMTFTEATMMEVQRLASVLPIAPPRIPTKDVEVCGYVIPKGTRVQINLYSLHRNPEHFEEPEQFRPQRFIDKDGQLLNDEWLQPFGYGKRKCAGENVAKNTVLLFMANLVLTFKFSVPRSKERELRELQPQGGLSIGPSPFEVQVVPR